VIIENLASPDRNKLKPDGTNVATWFSSLATFCGLLYKKFINIELTGLVQYIVNQLKVNKEK
jgi:THO complex subunit 2